MYWGWIPAFDAHTCTPSWTMSNPLFVGPMPIVTGSLLVLVSVKVIWTGWPT
jgi:hypothetical protein